jgi:hypothetical protein
MIGMGWIGLDNILTEDATPYRNEATEELDDPEGGQQASANATHSDTKKDGTPDCEGLNWPLYSYLEGFANNPMLVDGRASDKTFLSLSGLSWPGLVEKQYINDSQST